MTDEHHFTINDKKIHLILRDQLAIDRTTMANERTLLAHVRTTLSFFLIGVTFIKLFTNAFLDILGWVILIISVITMLRGLVQYKKINKTIQDQKKN